MGEGAHREHVGVLLAVCCQRGAQVLMLLALSCLCTQSTQPLITTTTKVQAALHANQTVKLPWRWTDCTSLISYSREDLLSSMLPAYKELLAAEPGRV